MWWLFHFITAKKKTYYDIILLIVPIVRCLSRQVWEADTTSYPYRRGGRLVSSSSTSLLAFPAVAPDWKPLCFPLGATPKISEQSYVGCIACCNIMIACFSDRPTRRQIDLGNPHNVQCGGSAFTQCRIASQLLLAPPFKARISSILATLSLNSSY